MRFATLIATGMMLGLAPSVQAKIHDPEIRTAFEDFKTLVNSFEFAKDLVQVVASSSDANVVTAVASFNTGPQNISISVDQLATNETWVARFSAVDAVVNRNLGAMLKINLRGEVQPIGVPAGTRLQGLADIINTWGWGLKATVYDSGDGSANPAVLTLTDLQSGAREAPNREKYNISIESNLSELGTASFGGAPVIPGRDLKILMGHLNQYIYRHANKVEGLIPGVSLQFHSTGAAKISITKSSDSALVRIKGFVDSYNKLYALLWNRFEKTGDLEPTMMLGALADATSTHYSGMSSIRSLRDLGIRRNYDQASPALELNEEYFSDLASKNVEEVILFFEGGCQFPWSGCISGYAYQVSRELDEIFRRYLRTF